MTGGLLLLSTPSSFSLRFRLKRAIDYFLKINRIGEEKWPKICSREELRGIINEYPSKWEMSLYRKHEDEGIQEDWARIKDWGK